MTDKVMVQQVSPGLCGPEGCPPPVRIECIRVPKVYDSCFQVEDRSTEYRFEEVNPLDAPEVGDQLDCG